MNTIKLFILLALMFSQIAYSNETAWKQSELTESFMRSLNKDQCVVKTLYSLTSNDFDFEQTKTLAGITGDCVTWSSGDMETFCQTFVKKYINPFCGNNLLDARDCTIIYSGYNTFCFTRKFPRQK